MVRSWRDCVCDSSRDSASARKASLGFSEDMLMDGGCLLKVRRSGVFRKRDGWIVEEVCVER